MTTIEIATLSTEAERLREEVRALLGEASDERCRQLAERLLPDDRPVLSLAFIGQYNAGKSSIIEALTGTGEVVVDANIATDRVIPVPWRGLRLIDTPGIYAQRPEHDQMTEKALASSDLLIFVITAEGFDATIASYFRDVVLERDRAEECLLVVNKSTQDSGSQETKLNDIAAVLDPLVPNEDVPVLFVDAQCKAWADEMNDDQPDRQELLELSGFEQLASSIDDFARRSGLRAQLTTPVYETLNIIDEALSLLTDDEAVRARLELLGQLRSTLRSFRRELDEQVREAITETRNRITALGESIAARVEPGVDPHELNAVGEEAKTDAEQLADDLARRIDGHIAESVTRLESALPDQQQLAIDFRAEPEPAAHSPDETAGPELTNLEAGNAPSSASIQELRAGLEQISSFFSENARAGESAHKLVYEVGKKLDWKFRPWEAVKKTQRIGRAAGALEIVTGVWEEWNHWKQERREAEMENKLDRARTSLRSDFQSRATTIAEQFEGFLTDYLDNSYDAALEKVEDMMGGIRTGQAEANEISEQLSTRAENLRRLLSDIRTGGELGAGQQS